MSFALLAALLLAAVFATAGIAKLADLDGSRRAVSAFGVPQRLAPTLGILLPVAELAVAGLLITGAAAGVATGGLLRAGALSAIALLALFCTGITVSLARGNAPDCHCFGQLHSAPAGPRTLARNGALLVLAAFVATGGDPAWTLVAGAAAVAGLVLAALLSPGRSEAGAEGTASSEGLPVGTPAPGFRLPGLGGEVHTLDVLRARGLPVLLVFTDPNCGPCIELAPDLARWQRGHSDELVIAAIEHDRGGDRPRGADEHGRANVLLQREGEVADLYRAQGTPTGVLVDSHGAVASAVAAGRAQIEALVARTVDGFESRGSREAPTQPLLGTRLRRREVVVRGAGAWAAISVALASPLRAVADVPRRRRRAAERCGDSSDCPQPQRMDCRGGRCRCKQGGPFVGGLHMENGRCVCDDDRRTFCVSRRFGEDNGCFLLQRDPRYCGGCDNDCVARGYDSCCDGECGDSGRTRCVCGTDGSTCDDDSICVVDAEGTFLCQSCSAFGRGFRRCGSECGNPEEDLCCEGKLYRGQDLGPGDWRCCGPEGHRGPVNVDASAANCGECGRRCSRDKPVCYRGRCRKRCPRRLRRCGDTCGNPRKQLCCKGKLISKEDAQSDPNNCGECGRKCEGPFDTGECCNGNCCDINGDTCCPDGCKNLALDDENCGGCGNVCQSGEYCRFGTCTQPPS